MRTCVSRTRVCHQSILRTHVLPGRRPGGLPLARHCFKSRQAPTQAIGSRKERHQKRSTCPSELSSTSPSKNQSFGPDVSRRRVLAKTRCYWVSIGRDWARLDLRRQRVDPERGHHHDCHSPERLNHCEEYLHNFEETSARWTKRFS